MWQKLAMDTMALCLMLIDCGLMPGQSLFGGFQCNGPPPPSSYTVWSIDQRGDMTMKNEHEDEQKFMLSVSDQSGFSQNAHDVVVDNGPAVGVMWPVHCFIGSWSPSLLARNIL